MRIWSLHPKYLDSKGLVALWRETLLARHVLLGQTKGYTMHPQLERFRAHVEPIKAIDTYLAEVHREAGLRGYNFSQDKFVDEFTEVQIPVTQGQLDYEWQHLLKKLEQRDADRFQLHKDSSVEITPAGIFVVVPGGIEQWERV